MELSGPTSGCAVWESAPGETVGVAKLLEKFGNINRLCIKSGDPEHTFRLFSEQFVQAAAAGGLVRNKAGEPLMIFRKGWWDLPKGHIDACETEVQCAVREVEEECGLRDIVVGGKITETRHIYLLDGRWEMKRTAWYSMRSNQRELAPEEGEGIERAEWVRAEDLGARLAAAYPTIGEVFVAEKLSAAAPSGRVR